MFIKIKTIFTHPQKWLIILSFMLSLLCLAYLIKGFYRLIYIPNDAIDVYNRWLEQQYIYRGIYPYNVTQGSPLIDPKLGIVISGFYPPWAFFTQFIIFPPIPLIITRYYHGILNFIGLVILAIFAYQIAKPYDKVKTYFTIISCLAISSHSTTIGQGQYGIIINAFLILTFWAIANHKNFLSGIFLALALTKPNISALYFLILPLQQKYKSMVVCLLYIFVSSLIIGVKLNLSPIYMLQKMIDKSKYFATTGYSGINVITNFGIDTTLAVIILGVICIVIMIIILYLLRSRSLLCLFAIASVIGRLYTYHISYDNVMLVFLLLAMLKLTLDTPNKPNIFMLSLCLISLILPAKMTDFTWFQILQSLIWMSSLIYIIFREKKPLSQLSITN